MATVNLINTEFSQYISDGKITCPTSDFTNICNSISNSKSTKTRKVSSFMLWLNDNRNDIKHKYNYTRLFFNNLRQY